MKKVLGILGVVFLVLSLSACESMLKGNIKVIVENRTAMTISVLSGEDRFIIPPKETRKVFLSVYRDDAVASISITAEGFDAIVLSFYYDGASLPREELIVVEETDYGLRATHAY